MTAIVSYNAFLIDLSFWSSFRFTTKFSRRWRDFSLAPISYICTPLLLSASPTRVVYLLQKRNQHCHIIITHGPQFRVGSTLGIIHPGVWTFTHDMLAYTQVVCVPAICLFLPPSLWQPLVSTVAILLPFPACHILGIIQYTALWDWLFSLRNVHLSFPHDFWWLDNIYFWCWIIFHCLDVPVYPFTYWKIARLLPSLGNYAWKIL